MTIKQISRDNYPELFTGWLADLFVGFILPSAPIGIRNDPYEECHSQAEVLAPQTRKPLKLTYLMKPYSHILQTALMLSALAAYGQGTFIYDQSSATNRSFAGGYEFQQEQPFGQSFTPSLASIGFVQMEFIGGLQQLGGATVYVNLRADSISGPILSSTDPVFMPLPFAYAITNFFFPTPVAITPGTTYYLQPVVQSGNNQWGMIGGPYNYQGGTLFWNGTPDPNGYDAWFREGTFVPEPSCALLVLLGIAGMCAARRVPASFNSSLL